MPFAWLYRSRIKRSKRSLIDNGGTLSLAEKMLARKADMAKRMQGEQLCLKEANYE